MNRKLEFILTLATDFGLYYTSYRLFQYHEYLLCTFIGFAAVVNSISFIKKYTD